MNTRSARFVADRRPAHRWRSWWRRWRPVERRFFGLLEAHVALCVEGLRALNELLRDVRQASGRLRDIEAMEKRADALLDDLRALVRRAWWPPLPSDGLLALSNVVDDVIDAVEDAGESLHLYHITSVTPEALRLAELALDAGLVMQEAIGQLSRQGDPHEVLARCARIEDLEGEADHVLRAAMSRLFREEDDMRQLIKLRAVYELLEALTDRCKDVAGELAALVLRGR